MARRRKKGRRRSYRGKKRRGGHKKKRVPIAATAGALAGGYTWLLAPRTGFSGESTFQRVTKPGLTLTARANYLKSATTLDLPLIVTPVVTGVLVSAVGRWVGLNKYVHKVPFIGKKVDI